MQHYIFGYGSLIEKASRLRTSPNASNALPAGIEGFKRGWFARTGVEGLTTTFLGCIADPNSYCNGVVYEISEEELEQTDIRERGYERIRIDAANLNDLTGMIDKSANIWIYVNVFKDNIIPSSHFPSHNYPIVQSYVDMCIEGCLEMESEFAEAKQNHFAVGFINSTFFWSKYWVNDRIYPRRPFIYRPNAYLIDKLLKENLQDKNLFNSIYFE